MKCDMLKNEYTNYNELINDLNKIIDNQSSYIFRGISSPNQLNPHICRVGDENLCKYEFDMLYRLYRYAPDLIGNDENYLDFVATAQHYGLPTRFVDWTRNPFVAIYFALNNNKNKEYEVIYTFFTSNTIINSSYYQRSIYNPITENMCLKYKKFIEIINEQRENLANNLNVISHKMLGTGICVDCTSNNGLILYDAPYSNERLKAQDGLFSIPLQIEGRKAEQEIRKNSYSIKLNFNEIERGKALEYLDGIGINRYKLFPDLQNLSQYIVDKTINGDFQNIRVSFQNTSWVDF